MNDFIAPRANGSARLLLHQASYSPMKAVEVGMIYDTKEPKPKHKTIRMTAQVRSEF
jgi:hypothetical protein